MPDKSQPKKQVGIRMYTVYGQSGKLLGFYDSHGTPSMARSVCTGSGDLLVAFLVPLAGPQI